MLKGTCTDKCRRVGHGTEDAGSDGGVPGEGQLSFTRWLRQTRLGIEGRGRQAAQGQQASSRVQQGGRSTQGAGAQVPFPGWSPGCPKAEPYREGGFTRRLKPDAIGGGARGQLGTGRGRTAGHEAGKARLPGAGGQPPDLRSCAEGDVACRQLSGSFMHLSCTCRHQQAAGGRSAGAQEASQRVRGMAGGCALRLNPPQPRGRGPKAPAAAAIPEQTSRVLPGGTPHLSRAESFFAHAYKNSRSLNYLDLHFHSAPPQTRKCRERVALEILRPSPGQVP